MFSAIQAIHKFQRRGSAIQKDLNRCDTERCAWAGPPLNTLYAGVSLQFVNEKAAAVVAIAIRDTTYLLDFYEQHFGTQLDQQLTNKEVADFIIARLREYSEEHDERFTGIGMPEDVATRYPELCSRLWHELDIVPIAFPEGVPLFASSQYTDPTKWDTKSIDELAEAMSRRCVRFFGPSNNPILDVGFQGLVEVDCAFRIRMASLSDYQPTVGPTTWRAIHHYAAEIKERNIKIAFFSATPQGGGVALMRHALVRFARTLGVDIKWYVPKPRPGVFRITKTNHNILQGVSAPEERFTSDHQQLMEDWLQDNANRYWLSSGGPLQSPSEGGADLVVVDDPQMPSLIPIAKKSAPDRPVIFRSHIQIRSDLVEKPGTPQFEAWRWLWDHIKLADIFISHPVDAFVPATVPKEIVGYMPATTDWLDGLNKTMRNWDIASYGRNFNTLCRHSHTATINYPDDEYIIQVARFDPSKGIIDALKAYAKFYELIKQNAIHIQPPKLLICGHGSVDDPDGNAIYDVAFSYLKDHLSHLSDFVSIIRLGPSDQMLNALLSKAKIALQLSTREGFEVKVSEAIHRGKPVIASRAGGIPLQVQDHKNGFLVEIGDADAVAQHLYDLCTDAELYDRMSQAALETVSDEVTTVGNALCWLYLASQLTAGKSVKPNEEWINDIARKEAGVPYEKGENRLKRAVKVEKMG
ncbi:hypothetical protein UA08_01663 [Talaromyces atroroseus]|uniref:Uncharacterized protein n=1 Tax=Talaromyces atroroseus TaxID=1441469 RepID=A0A1Q5QC83_TALAT|nr:hypothetical protein UA08_01663 [Talaromyces atroroseus]OKL63516.1 hypothetical protein UA08_01663 [Talaromyces atroroseus]